jgi:acyl carrier protein phosphodiesterase
MNYLAHLYFADNNSESRIGNLLGDFCRGVDIKLLSENCKAGLNQHRAIDRFTDQHAGVRSAKQLFSPQRRRFAGVALDLVFDHYLVKHWSLFSAVPFEIYKNQLYQQLWQERPLMPAAMANTITYLVQQDWFASYAGLNNIGEALDRIAKRLRFNNDFAGCITDLNHNQIAFEQLFLQFFPQLQLFVWQYQSDNSTTPRI